MNLELNSAQEWFHDGSFIFYQIFGDFWKNLCLSLFKHLSFKAPYVSRKEFLLDTTLVNNCFFSKQFVGNEGKGQISKRVLQENNAHQIFWKINIVLVCVKG